MTDQEKVKAYVRKAWPVASKTLDGCLRKSWSAFGQANIGLIAFTELLANEGFRPRQYGIMWLLCYPGPKIQTVKCKG